MHFLALLLLTIPAHAEEDLCPPAKKISASYGKSCHQNSVFAQAAAVCLKRLSAREGVLKAQLSAQLAAQVAAAHDQAAAMAGQVAALTQLSASLETLATDATHVKDELTRYSASFTLPDSVSAEQAKTLGLSDFFAGFPCYAQNQASLSESMQSAVDEIGQIEKTRATTEELRRRTASASASFTATPSAAPLAHGTDTGGAPSASPPAKPSNQSDITGTKPNP